jgi:hypothetical protein
MVGKVLGLSKKEVGRPAKYLYLFLYLNKYH